MVLTGVVAPDREHAVFLYCRTDTSVAASGERIRLDGLDDDHSYRVTVRRDLGAVPVMGVSPPPWLGTGVVLRGAVLRTVGLAAPQLYPQEAMLLEVRAVR